MQEIRCKNITVYLGLGLKRTTLRKMNRLSITHSDYSRQSAGVGF
jgi:hypothetical protein